MKKYTSRMFSFILIFAFVASCAVKPSGDSCKPKWYDKDYKSSSKVVYGKARENSIDESTARQLSMAAAQLNAMSQITTNITSEVGKIVEDPTLFDSKNREKHMNAVKAVSSKLSQKAKEQCNHCVVERSESCYDSGLHVIFTVVKIDVKEWLNSEIRSTISKEFKDETDAVMNKLNDWMDNN